MSIRKTSLKNNSGVILITVLMLTFVLSFVALSILSFYVSQVKTAQSVVDSIKAEQLALGTSYREYMHQEWQDVQPALSPTLIDGRTFSPSRSALAVTAEGIKGYQIQVTY